MATQKKRSIKTNTVCIRTTFSDTQTALDVNHLMSTCESLLQVKMGYRVSDMVDTSIRTAEILVPVSTTKARGPQEIKQAMLVIKTWCIARDTNCVFEVPGGYRGCVL